MPPVKKRIQWLDAAKFFGIFAVYVAHLGCFLDSPNTFIFNWIGTVSVALFFIISGCSENFGKELGFWDYVRKKAGLILIPFFSFGLVSIFIQVLYVKTTLPEFFSMLLMLGMGAVRNHFFAFSLWFLTCLFVMEIIFITLKLLFRNNRWLMLAASAVIYFFACNYLDLSRPSWFFNADSALIYMLYYTVGYVSFPFVRKLFDSKSLVARVSIAISGIASLIFACFVFAGFRPVFEGWFSYGSILPKCYLLFESLVVTWLYLCFSLLMERFAVFADMGRETLWLCGNEFIVKTLPLMIGIHLRTYELLPAVLYAIVLVAVAYKLLIPGERRLVEFFGRFLHGA